MQTRSYWGEIKAISKSYSLLRFERQATDFPFLASKQRMVLCLWPLLFLPPLLGGWEMGIPKALMASFRPVRDPVSQAHSQI